MPIPRPTALAAALLALSAAPGAAQEQPATEVVVDAATVSSLEARLSAFAAELPEAERTALERLKLQAAAAPADDPAGTPVRGILLHPVLRALGASGAAGAGGQSVVRTQVTTRTVVMQEGTPRPASADEAATASSTQDPRAASTGAMIGRLIELGRGLPEPEQAALDWLVQRSNQGGRGRAPNALPPGPCSLAQALGMAPDASTPPPPNARWVLKF